MNSPFPFGFPAASGWYLTLYVLTFCLHAVLMSYVFAGTFFTMIACCFKRLNDSTEDKARSLSALLRDWLPLFLSAAITAGVAPLLFIQILYRDSFYTANLLMFHRWMSILPVLIVGFYLLYVLKTKWFLHRSVPIRLAITFATLGCFAYTGWSWTENHLLSLQSEDVWVDQYESRAMVFVSAQIFPRLGMILAATFPTLSVLLGWQLMWNGTDKADADAHTKTLAIVSVAGLVVSGIFGGVYLGIIPEFARSALFRWIAMPYVILGLLGGVLQLGSWILQARKRELSVPLLLLAAAGVMLMWLGIGVAREAIRISHIDIASLYEQHQDASTKGGVIAFFVFAVINTCVIAYCIHLVRKGLRSNDSTLDAMDEASTASTPVD